MKKCKLVYRFFLCVDRACTYVCVVFAASQKKEASDNEFGVGREQSQKVERKYYSDSVINLECIKVKKLLSLINLIVIVGVIKENPSVSVNCLVTSDLFRELAHGQIHREITLANNSEAAQTQLKYRWL